MGDKEAHCDDNNNNNQMMIQQNPLKIWIASHNDKCFLMIIFILILENESK